MGDTSPFQSTAQLHLTLGADNERIRFPVWSSYSARQAAQLIGLSESAVRSCIRDGLFSSTSEIPAQLSFRDLAILRLVKNLHEAGVPMSSVRRQLIRMQQTLPVDQSITELALEARGLHVVIRGQPTAVGQLELPLSTPSLVEGLGRVHALPVSMRATAALSALEPVPVTTAEQWFVLGAQLEEADPLAAAQAYRRGLRLRPDAAESWINLGRLLAENDDPSGASQCFLTAAELDPRDATVHYNLGVVAQDDGRETEAIERYRRAIDLDPALAEAHYNLATLFDQSGDARSAIRHINEYRKLTKGSNK
jgi:hypothetical protein